MKSGRVEYAPDYKSESKAARLAVAVDRALRPSLYTNFDKQQQEEAAKAERAQLECEVINAARELSRLAKLHARYVAPDAIADAALRYRAAETTLLTFVDALTEFESKQGKK